MPGKTPAPKPAACCFYHRFSSRDVLLGELWLQTVLDFQQGTTAALDAGDGLAAALHTPVWVREHLEERDSRSILLFRFDDHSQPLQDAAE
jgi:hypothetical protein